MAKKKETKQEPIEKQLWKAADKLRKNIDAAEYKHIVLGLIFLKYISDSFEELYAKLKAGEGDYAGADPEDRDEYRAENVFFVPPSARWSYLQGRAKLPEIGKDIDNSMDAIERDNPSLKGVLPKAFAKENLDPTSLGQLIDLISNIALGDEVSRSQDLLGKVYEYFLGEFALAEGKKGGQFYTPESIVKLLVEMLQPYKGRVFDPCCGSGGMFVQSEKFILAHQGKINDISIYGQESNQTTWRLAKMNLAIRGIDSSQVKWNNEGSFLNDEHKDLKADYIIANPPFNDSDWGGELLQKDARWQFGVPPNSNANFGWVQHMIFHLTKTGRAGIVLGNSSLSAVSTGEGDLRKNILEEGLVSCIVAMPKNLFYNTSIPACLWFLNRSKKHKEDILFIDARDLGSSLSTTNKILTNSDINLITSEYKKWDENPMNYEGTAGFSKSVNIELIRENNYNLSPNRYIDLIKIDRDQTPFNTYTTSLLSQISEEIELRDKLSIQAKNVFSELGYQNLAKLHIGSLNSDTLFKIEQLLFKKWFIDFIIPSFKGFNNSTLVHTKNIFDFGEVPKEWGVVSLSKVAKIVDCLHTTKPQETPINTGNLLLQVFNISDNGLLDFTKEYFIDNSDYENWIKNIEVTTGDCIITNTGRIGAIAQIPRESSFAIGRNMTAVRPRPELLTPTYLINYLLSPYMKIQTYRLTDIGTILDSLNVKGIRQIQILTPPIEVQNKYEEMARPIREIIELNNEERTFDITM
ncbi:MAG: N-6 DNA methylase [Chitinophagales bacterium]